MSIPKTIHYCWFGKGPKPDLALKCIETWKKHCPDYEIVEWNESNFDVNSLTFTKEAYEAKKYAFVTDYVRLHAMFHYGGIYMDTDVEATKNLDNFLKCQAFSGFEAPDRVSTGIMASEKGFPLFGELMEYYSDRHFILDTGKTDLTTNVEIITQMLSGLGLELNGKFQTVAGLTLYPRDYFCPKDPVSGDIHITSNTCAIHHFDGSWLSEERKKELREYRKITKIFGINTGERLLLAKKILVNEGFIALCKRILQKFRK